MPSRWLSSRTCRRPVITELTSRIVPINPGTQVKGARLSICGECQLDCPRPAFAIDRRCSQFNSTLDTYLKTRDNGRKELKANTKYDSRKHHALLLTFSIADYYRLASMHPWALSRNTSLGIRVSPNIQFLLPKMKNAVDLGEDLVSSIGDLHEGHRLVFRS
jgi:hypothetical protein